MFSYPEKLGLVSLSLSQCIRSLSLDAIGLMVEVDEGIDGPLAAAVRDHELGLD